MYIVVVFFFSFIIAFIQHPIQQQHSQRNSTKWGLRVYSVRNSPLPQEARKTIFEEFSTVRIKSK